jgi:hypothetical protein
MCLVQDFEGQTMQLFGFFFFFSGTGGQTQGFAYTRQALYN